MPGENQPSTKSARSCGAACGSWIVVRRWFVGANCPPWLIQSGVGRSCIHQCPEPMWFSTTSMIRPTPFLRAWRESAR